MHLSLYDQGEIFRCAFLFGVGLGVFGDVFRLLRALGFSSKSAVFFQDVLFMSGCSVLCFLFAQTTVHGHFRLFVMAAHLFGFLSYRMSVGIASGFVFRMAGVIFKKLFYQLNRFVNFIGHLIRQTYTKLHDRLCENRAKKLAPDTK